MDEYTAFADIYDEFMDNVDYAAWSRRITEILEEHGAKDGLVLDLGCGTGILTELMAAKGYDMTGIDGSAEMLQQALARRDASGADILYLQQDMRVFELYGTMKAIISTCDSLNYMTDPADLRQVFRLVNNYLDPGGLFVFDFNTKKKYEQIGSDQIAETRDDAAFIWENDYDPRTCINEYQLTLFLPAAHGLYRRQEELHRQRGYDLAEIRTLLEEAGLAFAAAYDDYTENPADENSERIVVLARERQKNRG